MPITPDTKNWTWAAERRCDECGFDPHEHPSETVASTIRENAASWIPVLERPDAALRPSDDRWSDLEYACHVRDVYRLFLERLELMLKEENPAFQNWDQDATAVAERYDLQDPATVLVELQAAALKLADGFQSVRGADWERTGVRSDGNAYPIATLGALALHDPIHHLWDVALRQRPTT
jgi:hypothetical protein